MAFFFSFLTWLFYTSFTGYFCFKAYKESRFGKFFFLFFSFYYFSIRPIFLFLGLDIPIPSYQFQYEFWDDVLIGNILIIFWVFSISLLSDFIFKRNRKKRLTYQFGKVRINILLILSISLTVIGTMITLFYISKYGGVAHFLYQVKVQKSMAGLYVFREVSSWALFLSGIAFFYSFKCRNGKNLRLFALGLVVLNCLVIFSWGNRTVTGFFLFLVLTLYYNRYSKISVRNIVLAILILIVIGNGLRLLRDNLHSEATGNDFNTLEMMSPYTALALSMHWSEYDGLLLSVRDVGHKFSYRYGADFVHGVSAWVPRFLWPDKPSSHKIGKWFRQIYEPQKENGWPITSLGNWFVNGGIMFVLVGIVLTSMLVAFLDILSGATVLGDYTIMIFCVFVLHQGLDTGFIQKTILTFLPYVFFLTIARLSLNSKKRRLKNIYDN